MKKYRHTIFLITLLVIFLIISFIVFRYAPDFLIDVGHSRKYDTDKTGTTGDTFGGTLAPLIAWLAAILTFAAFGVQYRANQLQREQFEKQNQDQIFFRLFDAQESRLINSSFIINDKETKSFQLLERIVIDLKEEVNKNCHLLARQLISEDPAKMDDLYLKQMFPLSFNNKGDIFISDHFKELKEEFLKEMANKSGSERWEYIKIYFGSAGHESYKQKELLGKIGSVNFYKIEFKKRYNIYRSAFEEIETKYGSFLDGYLRGWEFTYLFATKSINKQIHIQYIISQLSKFEMIIIFYYIASNYADKDFIKFIKENNLLKNLHFYSTYLNDSPSEQQLNSELINIYNNL